MNNYLREFEASSETFGGYKVYIDIITVDSIQEICDKYTKDLNDMLKKNNLINLIEKLKSIKFHIHTSSFEDILTNNIKYYICDHC